MRQMGRAAQQAVIATVRGEKRTPVTTKPSAKYGALTIVGGS